MSYLHQIYHQRQNSIFHITLQWLLSFQELIRQQVVNSRFIVIFIINTIVTTIVSAFIVNATVDAKMYSLIYLKTGRYYPLHHDATNHKNVIVTTVYATKNVFIDYDDDDPLDQFSDSTVKDFCLVKVLSFEF